MSELLFKTHDPSKDFPLRASLFWKDKNGHPQSTWPYLCRGWKGEMSQQVIDKQIQYNSNCMTFFIYHAGDPECVCNPFVGSPNAKQVMQGKNEVDMVEVARWQEMINAGIEPYIYLIPCFFCGDDSATTNNEAFQDYFLPAAVQFLRPYSKAFIIASEADKSMNVGLQERMIDRIKRAMVLNPCPVGVHGAKTIIANNADFLAYEFSWHPGDGDSKTVSEVIREAQSALRNYSKFVWFQEMNLNPEGSRAKEQARALLDLSKTESRIVGLPGPCN